MLSKLVTIQHTFYVFWIIDSQTLFLTMFPGHCLAFHCLQYIICEGLDLGISHHCFLLQVSGMWDYVITSFPGSPERKMYTRGEPGIFSHVIMT